MDNIITSLQSSITLTNEGDLDKTSSLKSSFALTDEGDIDKYLGMPQVHIDNPALGPYSQARSVRIHPFRPERMANTIYQVQATQIAHTTNKDTIPVKEYTYS